MVKSIKIVFVLVFSNLWVYQTFGQARGISYVNGKYLLDTNSILANENLPPMINDLIRSDIDEKKSIKEIPGFIMVFLKKLRKNFTIANPGEDWQATDCPFKPLPDRQLVYFGLGNDIALMAYYTGGIGKSEHILIIKFTGDSITDFWCGITLEFSKNKAEILSLLQRNKDKVWGLQTNFIYF